MKCTINLPDTLAQQLEQYLKDNPNQTLDSLIKEALEEKLTNKNLSKLLNLAGIVSESPTNASDNPEDSVNIINPC
jgi:metal-responsive CopG/Arc/MetJ family transcriptional regulator